MNPPAVNFYEFGKFRLDAEGCVLFDGDNAVVDATPKALEILCVLVESGGRVVSKEEIIRRVWADSFVEEANLSHHIFRLRKALGECAEQKFIETVPKRGYRFVTEVREAQQVPSSKFQVPGLAASYAPPIQRNKNAWIFPAIILFLACGAAGFVWYKSGAKEQQVQSPKLKAQSSMTISRLTNSGKVAAGTISPDGKLAAYVQNYTFGEGILYVRQIETGTERKLLEPAERLFGSITFSPDGTFIYFISYEKEDPEGSLYRIPVIGGQAAKVLSNVKFMFSLAPDGKRAAFYRFDAPQKQTSIVHAAIDGSNDEKTVLTFNDAEKVITSVPAFSPDGRFVSFGLADADANFNEPQFSLFAFDLQSGETKSLTAEKWSEIGKTMWMPDGSGLVFAGSRPRIGNQIYFLSYPSGEVRRITSELNSYSNYGMGVSGDGSIMVADLWESAAQLWAIDADGATARAQQLTNGTSDGAKGLAAISDGRVVYSTRTGDDTDLWSLQDKNGRREGKPLTADAFFEGEVCAVPDSNFLVFASDRTGKSHIFRSDADGSNLKQLTFGDAYEVAPDCSPDGKTIFFESNSAIWEISVEGGEPRRLTDFECVAPSLSPDGKSIACIQPMNLPMRKSTLAVLSADDGKTSKTFDVIPFAHYYRAARWTPDGAALVFVKNEKLIGNLWRQNLSGGEPKQFTDFKSEQIFNCAFSRDGKKLLVSRGKFAVNVVMLKNFKESDAP